MIDLSTWNLSIPVGVPATTIETPQLVGGYQDQYFQAKNGAIFFWAPVNGTTTASSEYPRTELRETYADGQQRNWTYGKANNFLTATLSVSQVPSDGVIALGQIHTKKSGRPPLMLRYRYYPSTGYGDVTLAFRKKPSYSSTQSIVLLKNVRLNQAFSYRLNLKSSGALEVYVRAPDGSLSKWQGQLDSAWASHPLFFKAGVYTLDNSGNETQAGAASFTELLVEHR